ncbi:hypothetical protein OsJ_07351 [Oryza sativa Japonica Group]|uniref:Uncharacterized protein n=1 Tax=Oryza sativa subsp. japonica TaxID=39947 RepID=B9F0U6_ORYSJ|nr:hypothetical protein OsJ_07351 [Oryza sativa Japonica Group]
MAVNRSPPEEAASGQSGEEVVEVAKVSVAGSAVASAAGRRGKAPAAESGFPEAKLGGIRRPGRRGKAPVARSGFPVPKSGDRRSGGGDGVGVESRWEAEAGSVAGRGGGDGDRCHRRASAAFPPAVGGNGATAPDPSNLTIYITQVSMSILTNYTSTQATNMSKSSTNNIKHKQIRRPAVGGGGERPRTLDPRPPTSWRPDMAVIGRRRRRRRPAVGEEVVEVAKVSVAGSAVASAAGRRGNAPAAESGFPDAKLGGIGCREARKGAGGQIRLPGGQIWRPAVSRQRCEDLV